MLRRKRRETLRRDRVFRDRTYPLENLADIDLVSRYRFPGRVIRKLINDVDPIVRRPTYKSHAFTTTFRYTYMCILTVALSAF